MSSSWDRTIRIWNAWKMPVKKRRVSKETSNTKLLEMAMEAALTSEMLEEEEEDEEEEEGAAPPGDEQTAS